MDRYARPGVVASQPGLYFVGLFFLSALTSSLLGGVGADTQHIAEHITTRQPSRPAATPDRVGRQR